MNNPGEFYAALDRWLRAPESVAVATIVQTRGSSPREVGAKMLVRASGQTDGTVGGGCGEAEVWRAALEVLADHQPRTVRVDLTEEIALNTDGVCGGIMEIFVEPWSGADESSRGLSDAALSAAMLEAIAARRPAVAATVVSADEGLPCGAGGRVVVVDAAVRAGSLGWEALERRVLADAPEVVAGGKSGLRRYTIEAPDNGASASPGGQASVFFEVALPRPTLVIVGAGHIAVPLAQVGTLLDFDVVVVDDRPTFANASRFPTAQKVVVDDFEAALDGLDIGPSTYVVLVTRGHAHDVRSLRRIIHKPAAYLGMIGSRRRVFAVLKLLHDEGVPLDTLLRVHAPIGLDIKTETPGEIAVSIGAELLKTRRGGGAASFSDLLRAQYRYSLSKGEQDVPGGALAARAGTP